MSKRSIKKIRHNQATSTFKELVRIGNIPELKKEKAEAAISNEHIHSENCNH